MSTALAAITEKEAAPPSPDAIMQLGSASGARRRC